MPIIHNSGWDIYPHESSTQNQEYSNTSAICIDIATTQKLKEYYTTLAGRHTNRPNVDTWLD